MKFLEDEDRNVPVQSVFPPHRYVGSISESFEKSLNKYCSSNPNVDEKKIKALAYINYFRSIINPGEVVGVVAAQAIGEPATQMTLNTFHLAGYGGTNVTLGIPRLREILIIATHSPSTPMMKIPLKVKSENEIISFLNDFKRTPLRDVVDSYTVKEEIISVTNTRSQRRITVILKLLKSRFPTNSTSFDHAIEKLKTKFSQLLKRRLNSVFRSTGSKIEEINNSEESNSSNLNVGREEEMGADLDKRKSRKNEQNSYGGEEGNKKDKLNENNIENDEFINDNDETISSNYDLESQILTVSFTVSNVTLKILFESIVDSVLNDVMVHEISGVKRSTLVDPLSDGTPIISTEGVNFEEVVRRLDVNMKKFYTNDISIMLKRFGLECARSAIIKEVTSVFDAYGISVDKRHLQLIADYVTNTGEWLGMSRHSMKQCPSPFQKMSFETTTQFLTHTTMHGEVDKMHSPSASLAVGNVVHAGTGLCDILIPFE